MIDHIPGLEYKKDQLHFDGVSVAELAQEHKTPLFIYSQKSIENNIQDYLDAAKDRRHLICYSVKSNSNLSLLQLIKNKGYGADIVSGGELYRCSKAGISADKIVFSGVGKTKAEILEALNCNLMLFSVESQQELEAIRVIAKDANKKANISIRVNPNVDAKTHPYISTGLTENKFGIAQELIPEIYKKIQESDCLEAAGIGFHIGSQLTNLDGYKEAARKVRPLIEDLLKNKINLKYIDCGGGLGITYKDEQPPSTLDYIELMMKELPFPDQTMLFEPGRSITGNAGMLLTQTLYTKTNNDKHFTIVDAAMNDIIRPALYNGYHEIVPLKKNENEPVIVTDFVGPICESGDFIAKNRNMQNPKQGDYYAILSAGAYCFVMSSNYNSRPRAMEILIQNNSNIKVIRKRENKDDLIQRELECL